VKAAERVFEGSLSMQFDCQMSFTFRWVTRIPLDAHSLFFLFSLEAVRSVQRSLQLPSQRHFSEAAFRISV